MATKSLITKIGGFKSSVSYEKPSGGIPSSDLAEAVRNSLLKADTALLPGDIDTTLFEVVTTLPTENISISKIYVIAKNTPDTNDVYDEYRYTGTAWELIGSAKIDTTGFYVKPTSGIPASDLAESVQTSLGKANSALQSYTEQYTGTYTKPETGIPSTDLSSDVLTLLNSISTIGTPASEDYVAATYYVEGDTIPEGKNVGDVKTAQVGTAPTGLYLKIYNLEKTNEELNTVLDELLGTTE